MRTESIIMLLREALCAGESRELDQNQAQARIIRALRVRLGLGETSQHLRLEKIPANDVHELTRGRPSQSHDEDEDSSRRCNGERSRRTPTSRH